MVFRLPSHLESLVPAPSQQHPQPSPWRGSFLVSGMRASDRNSSQQLSVTAVETDGENRASQWPDKFHVRVLYDQPVLRQFEMWMGSTNPPLPLCTFMPNRLRDTDQNTTNKTNFRSLAAYLFSQQLIAVANWDSDTFPGAGIIIYPAQNTSAVLVGAIFFDSGFPDFVGGTPTPITSGPSSIMQPSRRSLYEPRISSTGGYVSSSRHHPTLLPSHDSGPTSPREQPIAAHNRHGDYRYMMTMPPHPTYGVSQPSTAEAWTHTQADDGGSHSGFPMSHNQAFP
ncbi:hypothetical protein CPB83DRAFT_766425 [Crepidotus variabilis]|uniref:Uncharacterized protein n=1 Tax=Crepidotus variabilis TaxID=179855 RepID=A0A9P6EGJ4_9AGAR|nr:hypothetical protein CPB83DRAFT_766425 [Crepidotus variabilis]